jgi:glycosyltransferase involved in cell wall biosynthesis
MSKNILFVNQSSEMYGSDKVLLHMVTGLQQTGDYHPIVILPSSGELRCILERAGIEVHVADVGKVSRASFSLSGGIKLIRELLRSSRPIDRIVGGREIALVHTNAISVLAGAYWSWLRRKRHVWHVHEIVLSPRIVGRVYACLLDAFANKVVFISNAVEAWLVGINPRLKKKSVLIFNGLPRNESFPLRGEFRQFLNLGSDQILVALVGRINRWKGHDLLVDAVDVMRREVDLSNVKFAIVGDTVCGQEFLKRELQVRIQGLGLQDHFLFVPFTNEIDRVWVDSDIAVVPSIEPEPFGLVAIEAMAAGLPVVAAAHGGLLDIVCDGNTGLLFEPRSPVGLANALLKLISDASLRKQYGDAGRQRQIDLFSLDSQLRRLAEAYSC